MRFNRMWPIILLFAATATWSWHELQKPLLNTTLPAFASKFAPPTAQDEALRAKLLRATRIDVEYYDDSTHSSSVVIAHLTQRDLSAVLRTIRLDPKDITARDAAEPYNSSFILDFYEDKKQFCYLTLSREQDLGTLCYDVEPKQFQTYYALQRASVARLKNALWNNPDVANAMSNKP